MLAPLAPHVASLREREKKRESEIHFVILFVQSWLAISSANRDIGFCRSMPMILLNVGGSTFDVITHSYKSQCFTHRGLRTEAWGQALLAYIESSLLQIYYTRLTSACSFQVLLGLLDTKYNPKRATATIRNRSPAFTRFQASINSRCVFGGTPALPSHVLLYLEGDLAVADFRPATTYWSGLTDGRNQWQIMLTGACIISADAKDRTSFAEAAPALVEPASWADWEVARAMVLMPFRCNS